MKTFAIIIAVFAVSSLAQTALIINNDQKEKLVEYHKECIEKSNVDGEVLKKLLDGEFPEDPKLKEYLFCVSKKTGFQNGEGKVQEEIVEKKLGDSLKDAVKAKELVAKCVEEKGSPTDTVYRAVTCLYKSTPTHIILVH